ncbi:MAG: carboxypeptidase-like regulatory domain-containing protein [Bacteroidota bacterium]|nr:carboxypeptidase-like regulatory domain-containing protein [Bacteroidota bacterium]
MKKIRRLSVMLVIRLFCIASTNVFAQHFGNINGSPLGDMWTIYLTDVNIDAENADAGDELAVFDGTILVGVYTFDGTESYSTEGTDYPLVTYNVLGTGSGYTPTHDVTFKFWDNSESLEITGVFNEYGTPNGAYGLDATIDGDYDAHEDPGAESSTVTFPPGSNDYSFIHLNFNAGNSASGTITITTGCSGAMEDVIVNLYDNSDNSFIGTYTPDSNGEYTINGLQNGNVYKITAALTNYTSYPTYRLATISGHNLTGKDFTLDPNLGIIKGKVKNTATNGNLPGALLTLYNEAGTEISTFTSNT